MYLIRGRNTPNIWVNPLKVAVKWQNLPDQYRKSLNFWDQTVTHTIKKMNHKYLIEFSAIQEMYTACCIPSHTIGCIIHVYNLFFARSLAATTGGTNTRNATFKIVHSALLHRESSAI